MSSNNNKPWETLAQESPDTQNNGMRLQSSELFNHGRRLIIEHRGEEYCLRLTRNDRLILNKL